MAYNRNKSAEATLGMPHGTARNRLRKTLLFQYVKKCGENVCFRCGSEIENEDQLSIEHKAPWEGVSAGLFWDLDNIAFSHVQCNRPDRPKGPPMRVRDTLGRLCCNQCNEWKNEEEFGRRHSPKLKTPFESYCKACRKTKRRVG